MKMTVALNLHKYSLNPVTVFFQLLLRALRDCIKSPQKLLRLLKCGDKVHSVLLGAYNLGSFFGTALATVPHFCFFWCCFFGRANLSLSRVAG